MLWIGYLLEDQAQLAWATVAALGTVASLGLVMAVRWIGVYRAVVDPGPSLTRERAVPPERSAVHRAWRWLEVTRGRWVDRLVKAGPAR
jgi:hypothetical protein